MLGLRNTRERLAVLYGDNHRFAVLNSHPGLRVDMALPLEIAAAGQTQPVHRRAAAAECSRGAHA